MHGVAGRAVRNQQQRGEGRGDGFCGPGRCNIGRRRRKKQQRDLARGTEPNGAHRLDIEQDTPERRHGRPWAQAAIDPSAGAQDGRLCPLHVRPPVHSLGCLRN